MAYQQQGPPGGYGHQAHGSWGAPPQQGYQPPPPGYPQGPPQGYPPQGYPPQGYPPQGYPPQGPPQGYPSQPYPPQGYQGPPNPPYGSQPPPGGPHGPGYDQPRYGQGPPPNGPPPQQYQGYGQPPYQGQPPGPPPQQSHYGAPQYPLRPPDPYGASQYQNQFPPERPSLGYDPNLQFQGNADNEAGALRKAMKGFGTDEAMLIRVLSNTDPIHMRAIHTTFNRSFGRDLVTDIVKETSGHFEATLVALVRGPLDQDVFLLQKAIDRPGTDEDMMDDVLVGRSNSDLNAIKYAYETKSRRPLSQAVHFDLSTGIQRLYDMIMAAQRAPESAPVIPQQIQADVAELHQAMRVKKDGITVSQVLSSKSDAQLRALCDIWYDKYKERLEISLKSHYHGHHYRALELMILRACNRPRADAILLERAMAGMGTKDTLLLNRVVRIHWDKGYCNAVKAAYRAEYQKDLIERVSGETSGDYRKLLIACLS